jgi:hypothetical protein
MSHIRVKVFMFGLSCFVVTSCGSIDHYSKMWKTKSSQDLPYRASLKVGKKSDSFSIKVRNTGQDIAEVRESVRFEATKYCLIKFGNSDVNWLMDTSTLDWKFESTSRQLTFFGKCEVR